MVDIQVHYNSFENALFRIKKGEAWTRFAWKGRLKYIRLQEEQKRSSSNENCKILSHLVLEYEQTEEIVPWFPTRCDLLENDWYMIYPAKLEA